MNPPRPADESSSGRFPVVRKGYQPESVDRFAHAMDDRVSLLEQRCETLTSENAQLRSDVADARSKAAQVDFSALGERAQEILRDRRGAGP